MQYTWQFLTTQGLNSTNPRISQTLHGLLSFYILWWYSIGNKCNLTRDSYTLITTTIIIMELIISRINIVAPLIVNQHTIWLMPLMAPFLTYNSNFKQQRKLKASLMSSFF
jgi:hypothetical protein